MVERPDVGRPSWGAGIAATFAGALLVVMDVRMVPVRQLFDKMKLQHGRNHHRLAVHIAAHMQYWLARVAGRSRKALVLDRQPPRPLALAAIQPSRLRGSVVTGSYCQMA